MADFQEWATAVISYWKKSKVKLEKGASLNELRETEEKIGMQFPEAFIELYTRANGFSNRDVNNNLVSMWPLKIIEQEYAANNDKSFVGFCDVLIDSHKIGFFKYSPGIYIEYDQLNHIATTFVEALDLINSDTERAIFNLL